MSEEITLDSVIDTIASIELQRQELHRADDPAAWRAGALAKLEEILLQLQEATRLHGPSAERLAMAEAVRAQISRVKAQAGAANKRVPLAGAPQHPSGGRGRKAHRQPGGPGSNRNLGRRSGR